MNPSPILSIIHMVTIGTIPNLDSGDKGHGLKNVECKQTIMLPGGKHWEH